MESQWLTYAKRLQAIASTGLHFSANGFDRERYLEVGAIANEMLAQLGDVPVERIAELVSDFAKGYATPKVDVRGALIEDGKVLLVREKDDGRWSLPGGWADVNQSLREAVLREVCEETGFEVTIRKLAAVFDRSKHPHVPVRPFHIYKHFFICEIAGGAARTSLETTEIGFFTESDLPAEISIGRVLPYQIGRMFAHYRAPDLPTEFD